MSWSDDKELLSEAVIKLSKKKKKTQLFIGKEANITKGKLYFYIDFHPNYNVFPNFETAQVTL